MDDEEALNKARELLEERRRAEFIKSFEKKGRQKTDVIQEKLNEGIRFIYGIPIIENKKLIGFDMFTYKMFYADGMVFVNSAKPCKNENGEQIRFSVDEYLKFEKEMNAQDNSPESRLREEREIKKVQRKILRKENNPINRLLSLFNQGRKM